MGLDDVFICIAFAAVVYVDDIQQDIQHVCYKEHAQIIVDQKTGENVREIKYVETKCPSYIVD